MEAFFGDDRLPSRFWSKVKTADACWEWQASLNNYGYGQFFVTGEGVRGAHRVAYLALCGPLPDALTVDHLCRNKRCVRPDHLEAVTAAENTRRKARLVTHCPQGHPLSGDNLGKHKNPRVRVCKACVRERSAITRRAAGARELGPPEQRTHCPQGHGYTKENTRVYRGRRHCRECGRINSRNQRRKQ